MTLRELLGWYRPAPGYWFVPKLYGWGATPVTWQGWALTLLGAALIALDVRFTSNEVLRVVLALVLFALFCALAMSKTDGGWRWRWGEDR